MRARKQYQQYNARVHEHTDLPDDIQSLKQLVLSMRQVIARRDLQIEHLKLTLSKLRRAQYGRSSEALDERVNQLELSIEELEATQAQDLAPLAEIGRASCRERV